MEQVRIVKEMRNNDRSGTDNYFRFYPRPRYLIWENVTGALTSPGKANKGRDFQAVITEIIRIVCPDAPDVPMPEKGAWSKSGCIYGVGDDGVPFSLAWRVHDAQFWGVPQRRRRVCVLADFSGTSAAEILLDSQFVRASQDGYPDKAVGLTGGESRPSLRPLSEGMRGNPETSGAERQEVTGAVTHRTGGAIAFEERAGCPGGGKGILISDERTGAIRAGEFGKKVFRYQGESCDSTVYAIENHPCDSRVTIKEDGICQTLTSRMGTGGGNTPLVMETKPQRMVKAVDTSHADDVARISDVSPALQERDYKGGEIILDTYAMQGFGDYIQSSSSSALKQRDYKDATDLVVTYALEGNGQRGSHLGCGYSDADVMYTLNTVERHCVCRSTVRRITPLECERLQDFPDGWTDLGEWTETNGKVHKKTTDADRYRALGNSIALPMWAWLARRICAQYERQITMGSLFDGIGGFPLVFQRAGAIPVWASEIEEFCIAVTKRHFGEE